MSLGRPELWPLLIPAVLIFLLHLYGQRRRSSLLLRFCAPDLLFRMNPGIGFRPHRLSFWTILLVYVLSAFAMMEPQLGSKAASVRTSDLDIVAVLDASKSMLAEDVPPSRFLKGRGLLKDFVQSARSERVGLVAFAGSAYSVCPLTTDYQALFRAADIVDPPTYPGQGTDLEESLQVAFRILSRSSSQEKAVLLISDGEELTGDVLKWINTRTETIPVYCIGLGSEEGHFVPDGRGGLLRTPEGELVLSKANMDLLSNIAQVTGGAWVHGEGFQVQELSSARERGFTLEKTLSSTASPENRYQYLLGLALLLLVGERMIASLCIFLLVAAAWVISPLPVQASSLQLMVQQGIEEYRKNDYASALKRFRQAHRHDAASPHLQFNLGCVHYQLGDYQRAAFFFRRATQGEDGKVQCKAWYNLGSSLYHLGERDEARQCLLQSLQCDPQGEKARRALASFKARENMLQERDRDGRMQDSSSGARTQGDRLQQGKGARRKTVQNTQPEAGSGLQMSEPAESPRQSAIHQEMEGDQSAQGKILKNNAKMDAFPEAVHLEQARRILEALRDYPAPVPFGDMHQKNLHKAW